MDLPLMEKDSVRDLLLMHKKETPDVRENPRPAVSEKLKQSV